jgi:hypothetical protein
LIRTAMGARHVLVLRPLPYFSTRRFVDRPRESFQARLDRLDYAGRQQELERARQPGIPPSQQGSFPDIIEGLQELARQRQGLIAPNFADEIEEIREFRRRFETNQRDEDQRPGEPIQYLADIILAARRREELFAPGRRPEWAQELIEPDPAAAFPLDEIAAAADVQAATQADRQEQTRAQQEEGPARANLFPVADPVIAKSGIQQYTGAQLDLLI